MSQQNISDELSAMLEGKPYKSYIKTTLGRVYVTALDSSTGTPLQTGIVLSGDPRTREEGSIIDVWSEREDYFFRRMNHRHFEQGILIEYSRVEKPREKTIEESTDDELKAMINKPFLALQNTLNKVKAEATLFRILSLAQELEKSEKVVRAIESRLEEVQSQGTPKLGNVVETEL